MACFSEIISLTTILFAAVSYGISLNPRNFDNFLSVLNGLEQLNTDRQVTLLGFSYSNCGGAQAMANISSLSVKPDPVGLPGPITIATKIDIGSDLVQPLKVDLYLAKKILGTYIKIPCVGNIGSCTYDDLCALIAQAQCPEPLVKIGIDCKCPLKTGSYDLPSTQFTVDISGVPSGDYKARADVTHQGSTALCIEVELSVK